MEPDHKRRYRVSLWTTGFAFLGLLTSDVICAAVILFLYFKGVLSSLDMAPGVWMLLTLLCSTLFGALLTYFYTHMFLRPLKQFTEATQKVADGDFSVRVKVNDSRFLRRSELGVLADSFNHMTDELAATEMFRKDFISNFSHEFKTPIISIRGFARQLAHEELTREQQLEFARIIEEESEILAGMSANVLLLTKLENQEIVTEKTSFSLDEQLRRCMLMFEEQWSALNLSIDMELDEIQCYSSEEMLSHVWVNLISNAVKFSRKDGALYVGCTAESDKIIVRIRDSGIGMNRETLSHIFDKFYQGDSSHTGAGNGLGLAIVYRILCLLGGEIQVESDPGFGSTFTVFLPIEGDG
ncbi:MAG: HAMP domain-containing histidine kinase [Clostridia bacterium]|nr:HAMP domain-containing histidine kinase [Clostridia bacterium]